MRNDRDRHRPKTCFCSCSARTAGVLCLLLIAALAASACTIRLQIGTVRQRSNYPAGLENPAGFRMESERAEYAPDTAQIHLTLYNDTDRDTSFGAAYSLETQTDGVWYIVPFKGVKAGTEPTWPAIAYQLPARGSAPAIVSLQNHASLEPGRYRVIKEVNPTESGQARFVVVAPFTISR